MDDHTVTILKSVTFIVMFILPSHLFVPKGLHFWEQWKKTGRVSHLSNCVAAFAASVIIYFGLLVITAMRLLGLT